MKISCGHVSLILSRQKDNHIRFSPNGWNVCMNQGFGEEEIIAAKKTEYDDFCLNLKTNRFSFGSVLLHNIYMTFAYALMLSSYGKENVSVLDYGGGLGHYYHLGKALLPGVCLDYHCKEVTLMSEAGAEINPEVSWYADDGYLAHMYDLVMINSSIQYVKNWNDELQKIISVSREYLFLTRIPVTNCNSFVCFQNYRGVEMPFYVLSESDLLGLVKELGMSLVCSFMVGDTFYVRNAPQEECELKGWLFKKV